MRWAHLANLAGALTLSRLAVACAAPLLVDTGWILPVYLLALATDVADGEIARRSGTASEAGATLDAWVDKTLHVNLGWALAVRDLVPDWFLLCWFAREIVQVPVVIACVRRWRLGYGPRPATTSLGRATACVLAVAFVQALTGHDASVATVLTGVLGAGAGLGYARRHLAAAEDGGAWEQPA